MELLALLQKVARRVAGANEDPKEARSTQAVEEYRHSKGINEEIVPIDWTGAYWRRGR